MTPFAFGSLVWNRSLIPRITNSCINWLNCIDIDLASGPVYCLQTSQRYLSNSWMNITLIKTLNVKVESKRSKSKSSIKASKTSFWKPIKLNYKATMIYNVQKTRFYLIDIDLWKMYKNWLSNENRKKIQIILIFLICNFHLTVW